MKAIEFDKKFEENKEDIIDDLDLATLRKPNQEQKRHADVVAAKTLKFSVFQLFSRPFQFIHEMQSGQVARITEVAPNQVVVARLKTGLSQAQFAKALHISVRTLQEWEQGRRRPSGAAQALIQIALKHPEVMNDTLLAKD